MVPLTYYFVSLLQDIGMMDLMKVDHHLDHLVEMMEGLKALMSKYDYLDQIKSLVQTCIE